jgi:hypothetical protein
MKLWAIMGHPCGEAFLLPIRAPIIEVIIDSTKPLHIRIHFDVFIQKLVPAIASIITTALHIRRTYQKLLGFFLIMK